uniref:U3 small nucleolar RNA-associated protein 15 homolog n=1 Tax=Daphnia lumholtzi TaxID=42856 RepID=A0A4Y7MDS5_9CRUS|nr:EOG090X05X9 [Daphnia lumholtzi]SVE77597.1 EOG090X05X9 [Daphnia lumholtzi]SVE78225.1 EOG090X05X9 [Daphnia lumholtzi]SVE78854.1 EOG090X05X9 [Daphnia lumholtzi]
MASFKKTQIRSLPKIGQKVTADTLYWRKLNFPVTVKEFGPIDYIDVMPIEPYFIAVSSAAKVQIYNPITHQVHRHFTRFKEAAYGASIRSDGKLVIAGCDEGHVKLFDIGSKSLLRIFKGHKGPVHRCKFTTDNVHVVSFSDDKSVALWDLPSETEIIKFSEHSDYVRAGCVSSISSDLFLSGSFDHTVKLYDARSPTGSTISVDHGSPVESVLMYPSNSIFVSVGGTELRVWDMLAGGRLLARVSQHHKTITCLHLASDGKRLVTGGLDRHAKIYDVQSYQVVHTLDFPSPVLSLGITPDDFTVVAGMANGLISMQHRQTQAEARALNPKQSLKVQKKSQTAYRFRLNADFRSVNRTFNPATDVEVATKTDTNFVSRYDMFLRKFQYSKALDTVLTPYIRKKKPAITVGVMHELIRRNGLKSALAGRDDSSLSSILTFLARNINDPSHANILTQVANTLLEIYESSSLTPQSEKLFLQLQEHVNREVEYVKHLMEIEGMLHILLASTTTQARRGSPNVVHGSPVKPMLPSAAAAANATMIYNVG